MNKNFLYFWENPKQAILTIMGLLMICGCINVFSASYVSAMDMYHNSFRFLLRYIMFACIGLGGMYFTESIGYKRLLSRKFLKIVFWIVLAMLVAVQVIGISTKGAARWLYLGPFSIQPSECAKVVVIMIAASYLGSLLKHRRAIHFLHGDARWLTYATAIYAAIVFKQPDLGTAAIIVGLAVGMFILAGIEVRNILIGVGGLSVLGAIFTMTSSYRWQRIQMWWNPWLDPEGRGYQMVQSLLSIGSGGLTGTNWGHGVGKFFYLPEAHTDFAFAIFCQENGFIGACVLLVLFLILGYAFLRITINTKEERGFLLAAGVTFLIIGQAAANMAMVCGIFPVIGVPLIFISYGGSSMVVSMAAIGMLLSVFDEECKREKEAAEPPEARRSNMRFTGNAAPANRWANNNRRWQK